MRLDREKALKLRLNGKSYNEIHVALGIPKSTLATWFTGLELSSKARERIHKRVGAGSFKALLKRNKNQTSLAIQRSRAIRKAASTEVTRLSQRDLFVSGVNLYWAEGYKRPILKNGIERTYHPVRFSNSDPDLIKIFLRFLREICKIDENRITAEIRIYQHHNPTVLMDFWMKVTGIKQKNFGKIYYGVSKSSQHKRPFNILPYGTIQISVNDTKLYHKIMGWIDGLKIHAAMVQW